MNRASLWISVCLISTLVGLPALAQTNIDQAAALAGGVSSCDMPGFPVTICDSGSYRLSSNLDVFSGDGIEVTTDDVTIDLNGFTIRGNSSLVQTGIYAGNRSNTTVRNGTVTTFTQGGLYLWIEATVDHMKIIDNNGDGLGFATGRVFDCTITDNTGDGIEIQNSLQALIKNNIIASNSGFGINNAVSVGGTILDNNISLNLLGGMSLAGLHTYGNNNLSANGGGAQVVGGVQISTNLCNGTPCP